MSEETQPDQQFDQNTLKNIVEAAILAAEAPVSVQQLQALFPEEASPAREDIQVVIEILTEECENRGLELRKIGKSWRFQSRQTYAPWLRKLNEGRPPRYSRALLETLAIIAYRQPVTRGDIEEVRGVAVSSEIMRTLQEREWVKQVGVRDVPGHPSLYGTTNGFLAYFNLESLKELPALIEQRDLETIAREQNIEIELGSPDDEEDDAQAADDVESEDVEVTGADPAQPTVVEKMEAADTEFFREIDEGLEAAEKMIDESGIRDVEESDDAQAPEAETQQSEAGSSAPVEPDAQSEEIQAADTESEDQEQEAESGLEDVPTAEPEQEASPEEEASNN